MRYHGTVTLVLVGLAAALPASAVSLASTSESTSTPPLEKWTAGSAMLVPLMAADAPAAQAGGVEAPAANATAGAGKAVDDAAFVRQATESGRKEVAAARNALPQLKNPALRDLAEMLVHDHSNANSKLSRIAVEKGWPVPGPQAEPPPPADQGAVDFDQKWTAEMIAGHERSVKLFRAQSQSGEDKELREFARDTLPTIEHHLAELRKLQK